MVKTHRRVHNKHKIRTKYISCGKEYKEENKMAQKKIPTKSAHHPRMLKAGRQVTHSANCVLNHF